MVSFTNLLQTHADAQVNAEKVNLTEEVDELTDELDSSKLLIEQVQSERDVLLVRHVLLLVGLAVVCC